MANAISYCDESKAVSQSVLHTTLKRCVLHTNHHIKCLIYIVFSAVGKQNMFLIDRLLYDMCEVVNQTKI